LRRGKPVTFFRNACHWSTAQRVTQGDPANISNGRGFGLVALDDTGPFAEFLQLQGTEFLAAKKILGVPATHWPGARPVLTPAPLSLSHMPEWSRVRRSTLCCLLQIDFTDW